MHYTSERFVLQRRIALGPRHAYCSIDLLADLALRLDATSQWMAIRIS
jgi:hypothetical protein